MVPAILHPSNTANNSVTATVPSTSATSEFVYDDSDSSRYELIAVVSHMGKNTDHGHYVCHIKKVVDNELCWVLYNDEKVAVSKNPPLKLGYMYLYKRI